MITKKSDKVPKNMQDIFDAIVALTDQYSKDHLTEEYAQLARYATAALCRKRPSPLTSGKSNTWACGVIHALGTVNFLFDKSQPPHIRADDLCANFGISKSTGSAKAKVIRDALDMNHMDVNWCLPSKLDSSPIAWLVMVNGLILDVRQLSREIQEEAFNKGLIPYVPADKV